MSVTLKMLLHFGVLDVFKIQASAHKCSNLARVNTNVNICACVADCLTVARIESIDILWFSLCSNRFVMRHYFLQSFTCRVNLSLSSYAR